MTYPLPGHTVLNEADNFIMSNSDAVNEACRLVSRQVKEVYRNLTIHFIVHHSGQRKEALAMAAQDILSHPAAETALNMLQKIRRSEESALLGTAVARKQLFFGLASQDTMLSLCTLNLDQFENPKDARRYAWHLAWHAIDALHYHSSPEGQSGHGADVIVRRRNALEMAGANLRADAFSAIISSLNGDMSAIRGLAMMRGLNALQTRSLHNPEFYPYVIAKESTDFITQDLMRKSLPKKRFIPVAMKTAADISRAVDEDSLRQWLAFSEPAQDMAWRGFLPEEVLAAAINTSDNTSVRATSYLVSEITGIEPSEAMNGKESYSPFADDAFNQKLHEKAVRATFEDVITQGLRQRSADPFHRAANSQNESLTEGHILGWCASALQSAGKTFQRSLDSGSEPEDETRREFEGERVTTSWHDLRGVGKEIVHQQRQGNIVTLSRLEQMCGDAKAFASIRKAILTTMRDPGYQRKLNAARDLAPEVNGPRPAASIEAAPRAAPAAPAPSRAAAPAARGMGMGALRGGGGVRTATTVVQQGAAEKAKDGKGGKDGRGTQDGKVQ